MKGIEYMNKLLSMLLMSSLLLGACSATDTSVKEAATNPTEEFFAEVAVDEVGTPAVEVEEESSAVVVESETATEEAPSSESETDISFDGYRLLDVDGGDQSGHREANVVVDIGFGSREYWAFTNEHGQLVRVVAKEIVLQDDANEPVTSNGRYYHDEAKVPGTEHAELDEGHVIADSLGGVSNAYNITPQDSTLNRHGDQAYMEKVIRDAGGATDFEAIISYPDIYTQTPSHYKYTYTVRGNRVTDEFSNVNPDKVNEELGLTGESSSTNSNNESAQSAAPSESSQKGNLSSVDANGNGKVTIKEAKDAGFKMPISRDHWLYQYMDDRDGDGLVGE